MAILEPSSYRMKNGIAAQKRIVFVKLTDSAFKAFEDLSSSKDRNQASIRIAEKEGCIQLPSGDVFNFAIADIPSDVPKGSFECIQKVRKGEIEHLGDIKQRINIHATEDSFSATKQKMTQADEESKRQCAKEIESTRNGPNMGNRVKVKRAGEPAFSPSKKPRPDVSPGQPPLFGASTKKLSASQPVIKPATAYPHKPAFAASSSPVSNPVLSLSQPSRVGSSTSLNNTASPSNLSTSPLPSARSPAPQTVSVRPLKERVIHALALKPMSRGDLLQKLQKFGGFREEERGLLDSIAGEVANFKDGKYDILSWVLVEQVDPKWPLYNPSDVLAVQRRLSMMENNRPVSAAPAAAASTESSVMEKNVTKTTGLNLSMSSSNLSASSASGKAVKENGASAGSLPKSKSNDRLPRDVAKAFLAHPNDEAISPPPSSSSTCSTPSPPDHTKLKEIGNRNTDKIKKTSDDLFGSQEDQSSAMDVDGGDTLQQSMEVRYGEVKSPEQRRSYKKDFYAIYNEYKELHEQMARISGRFSDLEITLRSAKKGTAEYRTICRTIQDDYTRLKADEDYKKKRRRWQFLSTKLSIIKQRIKTYDVTQAKA
ncbi:RNA polymerase II elongation factor ELL-like isoform X2 [Paramacrobiotus metropolitanus]|uniref:RNA polymerase II elongation factor ELL-like isoform X2 n=1 Tax=Paramacrobiotus metropolitanus TaxID=2943436 RepID=UPI0024462E37|nr:RNA polymerase II elongation factor ELL-like isoform X2 [Paramacrobiotus metropolitanus]